MKNIPKGGTMGESLTLGQLLIPKPTRMYVSDRPHLLAEYMRDKNPLPPEQVTAGSGKKVWWKCSKCNHPWQAAPNDRKHGKGCPACAGKRIRPDKNTEQEIVVNNLAKTHPHLVGKWHPTLNGDRAPQLVRAASTKRAWWQCSECGHSWKASINSLANGKRNSRCPNCRIIAETKKRYEIAARRKRREALARAAQRLRIKKHEA